MNEHDDEVTRRTFLKFIGASLALAGVDGCTRMPAEKILPFVLQPTEFTAAESVHYATSMVLDGFATGLVVEAHAGRPTKIEGNPEHPASLGAAGILEQGSLLQLYDPDRARRVRRGQSASNWAECAASLAPETLGRRLGAGGMGLALLLEPASSTVIAGLLDRIRSRYPRASVHFHAPLAPRFAGVGAGGDTNLVPQYDIAAAEVILAMGSDFLAAGAFHLRYAREFADGRRDPRRGMNRLYAIESSVTVTGSTADHRFRVRPSEIEPLLDALRERLAGTEGRVNDLTDAPWLAAVADDLASHRGRSLVITDERQSPRVQALAAAINEALGNGGRTVRYTRSPLLGTGDQTSSLADLIEAMQSGAVDTLVCLGGNPAYTTPAAAGFAALMRKVPNSVALALHENETAEAASWFVPAAHYLESWDDARARDGTLSVVQPLVQPLFEGKSVVELLAAIAGEPADPLTLLRRSWRELGAAADEGAWRSAVSRGVISGSAFPPVAATPRAELLRPASAAEAVPPASAGSMAIEVELCGDARVHDGAFGNVGWLQELPDPITKLTWDNAALLGPATARRLGVESGDDVILRRSATAVRVAALIVAGHADDAVALHLGYGRPGASTERLAAGVGASAYALWSLGGGAFERGVTIERAADGQRHELAVTQSHWTMEGRDPARMATMATYTQAPERVGTRSRRPLALYEPAAPPASTKQWAMTIDLGTCIGCSGCVVACQAENNIPVVGKDDVAKSREMQWLRIDRYRIGGEDDPQFVAQPMLCQQCEHAPCEYVCPVGATDHSPDGLNEMIYNRCVGTRFCSNNCPYKVRRFNWFDYNAHLAETERMVKNPDVTVRERGVMEKCTFCVQRIREAEIAAGVTGEPLRGSSVRTACQQACPTDAIVFGSLTEADSEVVRRREEPRAYGVLAELGTEPRVRYLAKIRNPNPALEPRT
jgi:Fe-S-cluster-containing dehydrogenase component